MTTENKQEYDSVEELKQKLMKSMGLNIGYLTSATDRSYLAKYLPKSQNELPKRSMGDSFVAGIIPLSRDKVLQDKYVTFLGQVRVGRLLEDMDIFAVIVAHKHILNPQLPKDVPFPQVLVTALVDKIAFTNYVPKPQEDIKISGHVSWAGTSSMEIVVWLEQLSQGTWQRITRALFVIVARDPTNKKSAIVNAIEPANDREKKIFSGGQERKQNRIKLQKKHVSRVIPDNEEQILIHDLYMRSKTNDRLEKNNLPPGCVWMSNCTVSNVMISQPENLNLHHTVFGGFIMRQATELSWVLGFMFSKHRPTLKSISDIHFQRPIQLGSFMQMRAHVVYTQENFIQMTVYVEKYNPRTTESEVSNTIHCTYEVPEVVLECIPFTYPEAMLYVDGRRHFMDVVKKSSGIISHKL